MPYVVTYLLTVAGVIVIVACFLAVIHVRNAIVAFIAEYARIVANPVATLAFHLRSWSTAAFLIVPGSAFAPRVARRLIYAITLALITLADLTITSERLAALYGTTPLDLPLDTGFASAMAWVLSSGFYAVMSLELRAMDPSHPWDDFSERTRKLFRWLSDIMFCLTALSGMLFWFWGAEAAAGSYPLAPVLFFMSALGLTLTVAAGVSLWASHEVWATLFGVFLVIVAIVLRVLAYPLEAFVNFVRRLAYTAIFLLDIFFVGAARPVLLWWTGSRLGKALGYPPMVDPIDLPIIGFAELPIDEPDEDEEEAEPVNVVAFVRRILSSKREDAA